MRDIFLKAKKRPPESNSNNESLADLTNNKSSKEDDFFGTDLKTPLKDDKKDMAVPTEKPRKKGKIWLIVLLIILAAIIISIGYGYTVIMIPIDKNATKNIAVDISEGETTFEIADALKAKDLIRSPWIFATYVKYKKETLLPGIYYLRQNMNFNDIIETISSGKVREYKITIPEGWRIEQISQYLADKKIAKYNDFLETAKGKEGYLFPDTYRISIDSTASDIIKMMQDNFTKRTMGLNPTRDQIILASIVEREARNDSERAKIAGVYQNRLNNDMKLEADPTVQYAKGDWEAPTVSDYTNIESPYNTYLNKGLPPGPICNPGLASIKAAINPEKNDYFYFFHTDGKTIFSKTEEEHNENKEKYLK